MGNLTDHQHDMTEYPPGSSDFEPLPASEYPAIIVNSEIKRTSNDDGTLLKLEFEIIGDNYAGRKVFTNLNLENPSDKAVEIARRELSAITVACGKVAIPQDSSELHNIPMGIKVKVTPPKGEYGPGNRITKYMPYNNQPATAAPAPQPQAQAAPAQAAPTTQKMPWQ